MLHESLPPFRRPAQPTCERLFFALRPPPREARRAVAFAERTLGPGWQVQPPPRLHVTLAITEDFEAAPRDLLQRLRVVGDRVAATPFRILLDRLTISHRAATLRPAHADPALGGLHRAIRLQWARAQLPLRGGWSFAPHMTLAYRDGNRPEARPIEPFAWNADELVLIRSLVGLTRHETLGVWPLRATPSDQLTLF